VYRDRKGSNPTINLNLKGYRSWGIATCSLQSVCSQYQQFLVHKQQQKASSSTCSSKAPEKGNLAFVAEPQLAVEGTGTYCTENTVRGTVCNTKQIDEACECKRL
jgi:hypothetical protein